jgi:hypothetical protein
MRTGFPQADARDDFERARRQARWVKLAGWLRGRPSSRNRLLVLGEVTIVTGAGRHGPASEAAVPIDHIVGSVEPTFCFDRHFRPTSQLPRTRFERIAADLSSTAGSLPGRAACGQRWRGSAAASRRVLYEEQIRTNVGRHLKDIVLEVEFSVDGQSQFLRKDRALHLRWV